jgi:hypothetical protein
MPGSRLHLSNRSQKTARTHPDFAASVRAAPIVRARQPMKSEDNDKCETPLARPLAPDDLRCGDFVSILHEVVEWPSFYWFCDPQLWPPGEPVRVLRRVDDCGTPLKVKAICLPFVFVKLPSGHHRTLDVRQHKLVRLNSDYAEAVWKTMSKQASGRRKSAVSGL